MMGKGRYGMIAAAAVAAAAMGAAAVSAQGAQREQAVAPDGSVEVVPSKAQQRRWLGVPPQYRSKGVSAKRRKRTNRLHVSKRVRRAHRRARKGARA